MVYFCPLTRPKSLLLSLLGVYKVVSTLSPFLGTIALKLASPGLLTPKILPLPTTGLTCGVAASAEVGSPILEVAQKASAMMERAKKMVS